MGATVWVGFCSRHEVRGAACLSSPSDGQWPVRPLDRDWCHPGYCRHRVCSSTSSSGHLPRMQQKPTRQVRHRPDSHFANQPLLYYNIRNNNHNCSRGNHNHNYSIRDNNNNNYYYNYSSRSNNYNYNFNYNYNNNYYDNYYNNYNYTHNYNNGLSLYCH